MRSRQSWTLALVVASVVFAACARSREDAPLAEGASPEAPGGPQLTETGGSARCSGRPTSLSGVVVTAAKGDPDPVYSALVYIPNGPVAPFPSSLSCDRCGALPTTKAVAWTRSGTDGSFTLEGVPPGRDVHLVVEVGRFRREVVIPEVEACETTALPKELTRLPRSQREGNIPRMAITTTHIDPIECVLSKMGIETSEFTTPLGAGRVHFYQTLGAMGADGATLGPGTPPPSSLYDDPGRLESYDLVVLPCEGDENRKAASSVANLVAYAARGGRVFTTHFSYVWLDRTAAMNGAVEWQHHDPMAGSLPDPVIASVDTTFPKGAALADWLVHVGVSPSPGVLQLRQARHDVDAVVIPPAQQWITLDAPRSVQHLTFNTPLDAKPDNACGRVVYSNFHVVENADRPGGMLFPTECTGDKLTAQEKVLAFMLLDLASCVQDDRAAPPR